MSICHNCIGASRCQRSNDSRRRLRVLCSSSPWRDRIRSIARSILKESNRSQARNIAVKLDGIGWQIVPMRDWDAIDFAFTYEECVCPVHCRA
jgi:hypothetical protein